MTRSASRISLSSGLAIAGAASLIGAAVSGEIAVVHMRWMAQTYGAICGSEGLPHCAACPTAVGLLMSGLALLAAAAGERRRLIGSRVSSRGR